MKKGLCACALGMVVVAGCGDGGDGGAEPAVLVGAVSGTTTEAAGTATVTVSLASKPGATVTLSFQSSDTGEGDVSPSSLTFDAADFDQAKTVTITGVDDAIADGDVAFSVVIPAPSSADAGYAALDPADLTVTNVDDDSAGAAVTASDLTTNEWGGRASLEVALTSEPLADVTFAILVADTSEGVVVLGTSLTFSPANWDVPQAVEVKGVVDGIADGDQAFSLAIAAAVSTDPVYSGYDPADVTLTNLEVPMVNVGYYDMSAGAGAANQTPPITAVGQTPVNLSDLTAGDLAGIDVLFVQNPSNSAFGAEYTSRLADIEAAVNAGMVLVIHDRLVTGAQTILPGGGAITFTRSTAADIQVLDPASLLVDGPAGLVTNTNLDGGTSSVHGFAAAATLPAGTQKILSRAIADEVVTFAYPLGAGTVVYSTIPLDYYLSGSGSVAAFRDIYAPNVIAFAAGSQ